MEQSAELEAAIMARRVDILALRAEARRMVDEGEDVWKSGITIPAGWLPALAEGLHRVICNCEYDERAAAERADGPNGEEDRLQPAEFLEQIRSFANTIRDVEPGSDYLVRAPDREALFRAAAGALSVHEYQLECMHEYVDPPILRFVAIEQTDALAKFFSVLWKMLSEAERD